MAPAYCETCAHFWVVDKTERHHSGRCHRFPPAHVPAVMTLPPIPERWEWPYVEAGGSCGEHRPSKVNLQTVGASDEVQTVF